MTTRAGYVRMRESPDGSSPRSGTGRVQSIGFVSTYPPTACGIATFTAALRHAIAAGRGSDFGLNVVSLVEHRSSASEPEVKYQHVVGDPDSLGGAVEALKTHDVAVVQHEYGIYGGRDGQEVLDFVHGVDIPIVVVLHTVPDSPTTAQRMILESIVDKSDRTVVLSQSALARLTTRYDVDRQHVLFIPHGAAKGLFGPSLAGGTRPVIMTWGLIGPGKGLETAIDAFGCLTDIHPPPRYVILGETHPKVHASQGDAYLLGLKARARALGLDGIVSFGGRYLDLDSLVMAIRRADIILIPYDSTDQVTSGVLVEAVAAGKPVVATAFPHAIEVLTTGAGQVVPHSDADAMSAALRNLLTNPQTANHMADVARSLAPDLLWPAVAARYESMFSELAAGQSATPQARVGDPTTRIESRAS